VEDQGSTRVAGAGGLAAGGGHTEDAIGLVTIGAGALGVADDLQVDALHPVGLGAGGGQTPSAGDGPPVVVHVVAIVEAGQLHLVDHVPEVHVGGADQGDVVAVLVGPVVVLDEVAAADGVGELGVGAPGGSVVDGHLTGVVGAVGSSEHPIVGDDGATAPPAAVAAEAKTHRVGSLALGGRISVHNAAINLGVLGQILGVDLLDNLGGDGGQSQSQNNEHFHVEWITCALFQTSHCFYFAPLSLSGVAPTRRCSICMGPSLIPMKIN